LDDVGGFPTDYSQFARREEVDTCLRLRLGGYRLWVVPQAICWHIFSPQGGTRELGEDWQSSTKAKTYIEHDLQLFEKKLSEWLKQDKAMALNIIRGDNDV
jgi:cytosine/adenosine deaminase-related metal-dependent hydrolase